MKFIQKRRNARLFAVCLLAFAIFCISVSAQDKPKQDAPKVSEGEAKLAKKLQEGTDVAAKMKLAQEFVKKYPNSTVRNQVANYIAGQIGAVKDTNQKLALFDAYSKTFTNAGEADYTAPAQIETYAQLKRYDDAFKLAGDYLSRAPEDVRVRYFLSIEGSNLARAGESKFAAQTRDLTVKAVEIIESGKKPADLSDDEWKTAQNNWIAQLYQSLGFLDFSAGNRSQAFTNFEKAAKLDAKDVNNWAMMGFIINRKYQDSALDFAAAPREKQPELRKKAEAELDQIIEIYARVVAITDGNAAQQNLNSQMRKDLEEYYKFRHNNSIEGLQALIDKYKTQK